MLQFKKTKQNKTQQLTFLDKKFFHSDKEIF